LRIEKTKVSESMASSPAPGPPETPVNEDRAAGRAARQAARAARQEARAHKRSLRQEERRRARESGTSGSETADRPDAAAGLIAGSGQSMERLKVFTDAQVAAIADALGEVRFAPWPQIDGCLAILFTSRSGSTYLARELECAFKIGRLRESLRPERVKGQVGAQIVDGRRDPWFSFKAGGHSVIAGELCGFFDAYLRETAFILLLRRDIVAQAVSCVKARQTGQYHSTQKAMRPGVYDGAKIAQYVSIISRGAQRLRLYAERSGRPWRPLVYEDFAGGDCTQATAACDALGVPRRRAGSKFRPMPVERIGDATNEAWAARFRGELDGSTRDLIERYETGF
jgi:LPS sulfotransferase NodH